MIYLARGAEPRILVRQGAKWKAAISAARTAKAREKAQGKYKHPSIKEALVQMFHGKCAYCESAITHIEYGHIEHFKPKSLAVYYELAVDWTNLLLACGRCNGAEHKGVKFPGPAEGGPLVDPSAEDPSNHLRFDFDVVTKLANVLDTSQRGETTWRTLGLNRPDLVRRRSEFVKKLWVIGLHYFTDPQARAIIDTAADPGAEYAAFARALQMLIQSHSLRS
jgi:uncharacterized protein (TIGR02646 family)